MWMRSFVSFLEYIHLREPSILGCATFSAVASVETCLPTIASLLREGYHPNAEVDGIVTVWQMILDDLAVLFWNESREVRSSVYFAHKASWLSLCKLFVVNGADLSMRLALDRGAALSPSLTIPEYLNESSDGVYRAVYERFGLPLPADQVTKGFVSSVNSCRYGWAIVNEWCAPPGAQYVGAHLPYQVPGLRLERRKQEGIKLGFWN